MSQINKHPFSLHRIEVSPSLHAKIMQTPLIDKKLKRQTAFLTIVTVLSLTFSLFYFQTQQDKLTEEQLLETQYANFGSNLSI